MSIKLELSPTKQQIAELPEQMMEGAWEEIIQLMTTMKGFAQVFVLVDTGALRDSIRVERGGKGKGWRVIRLRAGGYVINQKTGRLVDYACIIERKHSYICRAWYLLCSNVENLIRRGVLRKVT